MAMKPDTADKLLDNALTEAIIQRCHNMRRWQLSVEVWGFIDYFRGGVNILEIAVYVSRVVFIAWCAPAYLAMMNQTQ